MMLEKARFHLIFSVTLVCTVTLVVWLNNHFDHFLGVAGPVWEILNILPLLASGVHSSETSWQGIFVFIVQWFCIGFLLSIPISKLNLDQFKAGKKHPQMDEMGSGAVKAYPVQNLEGYWVFAVKKQELVWIVGSAVGCALLLVYDYWGSPNYVAVYDTLLVSFVSLIVIVTGGVMTLFSELRKAGLWVLFWIVLFAGVYLTTVKLLEQFLLPQIRSY